MDWNRKTINISWQIAKFAYWIAETREIYSFERGTKTHKYRGTLNLVIGNERVADKILNCYLDISLDVTNNHEVIRSRVEWSSKDGSWNSLGIFDF